MNDIDILLVEDDHRLASLTSRYLQQHKFKTHVEGHCEGALSFIRAYQPRLILLDLNLPDGNGLALCKSIRQVFSGPILMLTARDGVQDQVVGFESGADDYITKPVDPQILLARIHAFLRRSEKALATRNIQSCGKLVLKKESQQIFYDDIEVKLTAMEFTILSVLIENAGTIVSREVLHNKARGLEYDGLDRTVDVRISRIRKKFNDNPDDPKRIRTVWGKGYLLVPDEW